MQKAAELVGGDAKLCRLLKVPLADLRRWIDDQAHPPRDVFLRAVDVILDETPVPPGDSEPTDPPAPRDCAASGDFSGTRF